MRAYIPRLPIHGPRHLQYYILALRPDATDLQELPITIGLGAIYILFGRMAAGRPVELTGCNSDETS